MFLPRPTEKNGRPWFFSEIRTREIRRLPILRRTKKMYRISILVWELRVGKQRAKVPEIVVQLAAQVLQFLRRQGKFCPCDGFERAGEHIAA